MSDVSQEILFTTAGLDTDASYEYIKNGDAPYRLNILISEDGANGVVTNMKGCHMGATSYPLTLSEVYKVVGSYYNRLTRKCYYFVFSLPYDSDLSENYIYDNKLLCYNEDTETIDCIFTDTANWFGLSPYHFMKDCRMIGTWLFFNPQISEPKMIDVDMAFIYEKAQITTEGTSVGGYYEWSAAETYTFGGRVIYLGGYWLANQATAAGESPVTNPEKWDRLANCYQYNQQDASLNFLSEFEYAFNVIKMPPPARPIVAYGTDTEIQENNVRGKAFRFAYYYKYFDNTNSVFSAYSAISLPVGDEKWDGEIDNDAFTNNHISVDISLHSAALVKEVVIVFQEIGGDWKKCKVVNRQEQDELDVVNFTYLFYNDEVYYESVPLELVTKIYDAVPRTATTQELINKNILAYGRCKEGFDNLDKDEIDVTLTPRIEPISDDNSVEDTLKRDNVANLGTDITQITSPGPVTYHTVYYTIIDVTDYVAWGVVPGDYYELTINGNHRTIILGAFADANELATLMLTAVAGSGIIAIPASVQGNTLRIGQFNIYPKVSVSKFWTHTTSGLSLKYTGFKTGSNHPFCIFYYDESLRRWDAQTSKENVHDAGWTMFGTTVYVPTFMEVSSPAIDTANRWVIDWEVDHLPPLGAKYWRWGYAGNSLCSEFVQYIVSGISNDGSTTLTAIDITPLQEIKDPAEATWNEYPQSNIGQWLWQKGDRIRFITEAADPDVPGTVLGDVIDGLADYEITKQSDDGNTIYIQQITIADIGENTLVEIYRPRKGQENTHKIFYEFGNIFPIIEDTDGELVHAGLDQNQDTLLAQPATGTFEDGDVYHIMRTPSKFLDTTNKQVGAFHESLWWSDFYDSDDWDRGKPGEETNFNERTLNIVRYSNVYLQNTGINGFSTFDTNDTEPFGYKELNDVYGDIIAMMEIGDTLKVYQKTKPSSILIGRSEYVDTSGDGDITVSKSVLGSIRYSPTNYGTEFPESITRNNRYVYGFDIYNGVVWRDSANGIFPISGRYTGVEGSADYRMATWFKEKAKALLLSGVSNVDVMSWWDEEYKLVYFSFRDSITEANNATIAFHEPSNRWISFYDFESVDHDGYNIFLELSYAVVQGFEAGIGFFFNVDDRFAYFDIESIGGMNVYPTLITLNMGLQTPVITASGSGTGTQQGLNFELQTPVISISYVKLGGQTTSAMTWNSYEYGSSSQQSAVVTGAGVLGVTITAIPDWLTVVDSLGTVLSVDSVVNSGDTLYLYPTEENLIAHPEGDLAGTFTVMGIPVYGGNPDRADITVTQYGSGIIV